MRQQWKLEPWKFFGLAPRSLTEGPGTEDEITIRRYKKKLGFVFSMTRGLIGLAVAWTIVCISFYLDFYEKIFFGAQNWFAPSGALLVFLGVFVEWRVREIVNWRQTDAEGPIIDAVMRDGQRFHDALDIVEKVSIRSALSGTLIWAYGDKFVGLL